MYQPRDRFEHEQVTLYKLAELLTDTRVNISRFLMHSSKFVSHCER
jgi:hypothetical protein